MLECSASLNGLGRFEEARDLLRRIMPSLGGEELGWEGSIQALRSAYRLDPEAEWQYDVAEARARGEFSGEFLAGVYSEWALEVGRELEGFRPERGERSRLN